MRSCIATAAVLCLAGCNDFEDALQDERDPANPPGIAGAEDLNAGENAGQGQNADQGKGDGKGIIGKTTNKIVDAKQWRDKPNIVEVENKVSGGDPLTTSMKAYVSLRSKVSMLNFQHNLDIQKAATGRNPTYDELVKMMKQFDVELAMLYPWQMYAYDEDTGKIVVLEDRAKKKEKYEEAGLEYEEE